MDLKPKINNISNTEENNNKITNINNIIIEDNDNNKIDNKNNDANESNRDNTNINLFENKKDSNRLETLNSIEKVRESLRNKSLNSYINYYNIEESKDYEAITMRNTVLNNDLNYHMISSKEELNSRKSKSINGEVK